MIYFFKRVKKRSDFEIDSKLAELVNKIDCLQISEARSRKDICEIVREDIRQIVREEFNNVLNERNRKAWWNIA